jgi:hypothetical protein
MRAKKKYQEGGILGRLKNVAEKSKDRKQFKKDVKSGSIQKIAESKNGDAAQRSADRNGGIVKYKNGTYTVYKKMQGGGMIKRADGSYSKRGLWDNIRANRGSGKKPTKQMLAQEKEINKNESKKKTT